MLKTIAITAAFALAATGAAAQGYKLDTGGKCRDDKGHFATAEKCKTPTPAKAAQCKDAKGKFAKCGTPGATPVKK